MLDNSIILKLESLCARSEEIKLDLSAEGATDNMTKFTQLNKEYSEITPVVNLFESLKNLEKELLGATSPLNIRKITDIHPGTLMALNNKKMPELIKK